MQQKAHARTILFLSNGYGEDTVGARIAQSVQALAGSRLRPVASFRLWAQATPIAW